METLKIVSSIFFMIGFFLILYMLSGSEGCYFDAERVNLICPSGSNISEKALFVIVAVFFVVFGFILLKKSNEVSSF